MNKTDSNSSSTFPMAQHILIINEKPSVSMEFSRALRVKSTQKHDGYIEGYSEILGCMVWITWCVGHLVTMSYPEKYDEKYKKWNLEDLPFLPTKYNYEIIDKVEKQFEIVKRLLNSVGRNTGDDLADTPSIYYAGDAGREGVYIQALVRQMAGHNPDAKEYIVWIDSQTDTEIQKGIRNAKSFDAYLPMIQSGYERAIDDFAIGINFSRALSVQYAYALTKAVKADKNVSIAVGRVMSCVQGLITEREMEIKRFKPIPFYKISATYNKEGIPVVTEWKIPEGSKYRDKPQIYENMGFHKKEDAEAFIKSLPEKVQIASIEYGIEKKKAPALFNLPELQAECSKKLKISPDETLNALQSLYEKKLVTYPRTDSMVLSTAVAEEIESHVKGLAKYQMYEPYCSYILDGDSCSQILKKKKYVDDTKVTDHYAIIPTGYGKTNIDSLSKIEEKVFDFVVRRFLSIFYPPAEYETIKLTENANEEIFAGQWKLLSQPGYLTVAGIPIEDKGKQTVLEEIHKLKENSSIPVTYAIIKGETSAPKRYTSGSIILTMKHAGNLIEEEELREQITTRGIGTSATRAEVIKKLVRIGYIDLNPKTQVLTPTKLGTYVYTILKATIPSILKPTMTASWEKGLSGIAEETLDADLYRRKMEDYVRTEIENMRDEGKEKVVVSELQKAGARVSEDDVRVQAKPFISEDTGLKCPMCGGAIMTARFGFVCENYKKDGEGCSFIIGRICTVKLKPYQLKTLVSEGKVGPIDGFISKKNKKFAASLVAGVDENGKYKLEFDFSDIEPDYLSAKCPRCKGRLILTKFGCMCEHYDKDDPDACSFGIGKIAKKKLTAKQMEELIKKKIAGPIDGFTSKEDKKFSAYLKMDENALISFYFPEATESKIDCPKCRQKLKRASWCYECDCGYKIPHTIAKKSLSEEQVKKLITEGHTPLLRGFVSKKGKKFEAALICDENGHIEFDFDA